MAYFHDCVEYYSPGYGLGAVVVAFVCGGLLGALLNALIGAPKPEFPALHDQPFPVDEQLRRAWHVIIVLLVLLWISMTTLAFQNKESLPHLKTEL